MDHRLWQVRFIVEGYDGDDYGVAEAPTMEEAEDMVLDAACAHYEEPAHKIQWIETSEWIEGEEGLDAFALSQITVGVWM